MKKYMLVLFALLTVTAGAQSRWDIRADGSIVWRVAQRPLPHYDHIEMSGEQLSAVLRYGVNADGSFALERSLVWPLLRTLPDDTHASLMKRFSADPLSSLIVDGRTLGHERVDSLVLSDGMLYVYSRYALRDDAARAQGRPAEYIVALTRAFGPSPTLPCLYEEYALENLTDRPMRILCPDMQHRYRTPENEGKDGSYILSMRTYGKTDVVLEPGGSAVWIVATQGRRPGEPYRVEDPGEAYRDMAGRRNFAQDIHRRLEFVSPDTVLNTAFAFAKVRAAESIFRTAGGLMHGPGGEAYYAAVWANDQAEYVNPFFPFLGYETGNESALNAFRHFARFMNPEYNPLPSSIIAEGRDVWNGAGDRGDAAMIAYGTARYALARADRDEARELWPLVEWCLEYCRRNLDTRGVVRSDCDELENRFPAGDANLCTSSLYYDALLSAAYLAGELNLPRATGATYRNQAAALAEAIEKHFGTRVEGYDTYRYYEGNEVLRSWICMPLTVGIFGRSGQTVEALFSPRLWTRDGLLTEAGSETFWDRSTLYALRGVLAAGERRRGMEYLRHYSAGRLLGEHVPYPIEAWPEGDQRHLSAESGLYCRIVTEGLFGIRPTGFRSFTLTPQLPEEWDRMELRRIGAFGGSFDLRVERLGSGVQVTVVREAGTSQTYRVKNGTPVQIRL